MFLYQNHCAAEGENSLVMVGMFVCLCLAILNSFEGEFFIPTRMDLGVMLLTNMDGHEHPLFNEFLWH